MTLRRPRAAIEAARHEAWEATQSADAHARGRSRVASTRLAFANPAGRAEWPVIARSEATPQSRSQCKLDRDCRVAALLAMTTRGDRYLFCGGTGIPGIFTLTAPRWFRLVKYSVFQSSPPKRKVGGGRRPVHDAAELLALRVHDP